MFSVNPLKLKEDNTQSTTDIANITVTTLCKKSLDLFQVFLNNEFNVGTLYSGSSSTNGSIWPLNLVLFNNKAINMANTMPIK